MSVIIPKNGQSNFDLCLQLIGGLDGFFLYLSGNNISVSSVPASNPILVNPNNILSKTISGYAYATYNYAQTLLPLLNNDGTPLLNNNGQPLYNNTPLNPYPSIP